MLIFKTIPSEGRVNVQNNSLKKYFEFMYLHSKTQIRNIILVFSINILSSVVMIFFAYMSRGIIDNVFINKDIEYLHFTTRILLIGYLMYFILEIIGTYYITTWKVNIDCEVKKSFFNSINNIAFSRKDVNSISDTSLYHRLFSDGTKVSEYYYTFCIIIPFNFLFVVCMLLIMFNWSVILTMYALLLIAFELLTITVVSKPIENISKKQKSINQNLMNFVFERIQLIQFFQLLNLRKQQEKDVSQKFDDCKNTTLTSIFSVDVIYKISSMVRQFWSLGLLIIGANLIIRSEITVGLFVGFQTLVGYMLEPFFLLVNSIVEYQNNKVCFNRFLEYFELPKIDDRKNTVFKFEKEITFDNVSFGYVPECIVIRDIKTRIEKGEFVVVTGTSGSGKTTLMNLFLRQYYPDAGCIRIDNIDINTINYDSYMEHVGSLFQKPVILNDTLKNNITLHRECSDRRIVEILDEVKLKYLYEDAGENLNFNIFDRKEKISLGEAQRINIARILLRKNELAYLDEPTSALDCETEILIFELLKRYCVEYNMTLIINSHSKKALQYADRVIDLEEFYEEKNFGCKYKNK